MIGSDFITEQEASSLAGVSTGTLSRFVEAGYLKVQTDQEGIKKYSKSELGDIFGIHQRVTVETYDSSSINEDPEVNEEPEEKSESYWAEAIETPPVSVSEIINQSAESAAPEKSLQESSPQDSQTTNQSSPDLEKLKSIIRMQEKIIDMREQEINDLRKDRDWLRNRVERYEEKSERDQLLLLSETQMIRKLVNMSQEKKTSNFRLALEWLGLVPPKPKDDIKLPSTSTNHRVVE